MGHVEVLTIQWIFQIQFNVPNLEIAPLDDFNFLVHIDDHCVVVLILDFVSAFPQTFRFGFLENVGQVIGATDAALESTLPYVVLVVGIPLGRDVVDGDVVRNHVLLRVKQLMRWGTQNADRKQPDLE